MAFATVGASLTFATVISNVSDTEALLPSVAVTLTEIVPTLLFAGVPLKVRVPASKLNQVGKLDPSERVAD